MSPGSEKESAFVQQQTAPLTYHQCPRCHRKYTREKKSQFDNTTYWQNCSKECLLRERPIFELKVTGPGRLPTKGYHDDCGMDLYTYCDPNLVTDQDSLNELHGSPFRHILYKNSQGRCVPENFSHWEYQVPPGGFVDLDLGISIELPEGVWGLITGRSSAIRKKSLLIVNGIIDTGYRGRLYMPVLNVGHNWQKIEHDERVGQLILMNNVSLGIAIRAVDSLNPSPRGTNGFGSTGQK